MSDDENGHLLTDPEEHRASVEAGEAWQWLKATQHRTMNEWLKVGAGFRVGRAWAMRRAGVRQPAGRGYNELFSHWLLSYGMADIDQADRFNLFKLMDQPEVIAWRNSLIEPERRRLNHPTTILRAYARWQRKETEDDEQEEGEPMSDEAIAAAVAERASQLEENLEEPDYYELRERVASLTAEVAMLRQEIASLRSEIALRIELVA